MSKSTALDQNTLRRRGVGLRAIDRSAASPGYTLFAPLTGRGAVYLIDLDGEVVHEWKLPYAPGQTTYLLPNGNLFYNGKLPDPATRLFPIWSAYGGGVVLEADPSGKIVWEWRRPDHHHDASQLRNGNAIVLGLEKLPAEFAARLRGGQPNSEFEGASYGDVIYEVDRKGEIVWTWRARDHVRPEDAVIHAQDTREHWPMGNSVNELSDGNILISFRNVSKVVIISRKTGEVLFSLDHPVVAQQHYPHELANRNILLFDNGSHRTNKGFPYSRVIEVDRKTKQIVWEYSETPPQYFFSPYMSSAQRLPNGNTLITEASFGRIFEVTPQRRVVWEYVVPYFAPYEEASAGVSVGTGEQNAVHRAFRYTAEQIPWLARR
jgi:outer membrane protein assembly factor BamB